MKSNRTYFLKAKYKDLDILSHNIKHLLSLAKFQDSKCKECLQYLYEIKSTVDEIITTMK